MDVTQTFNGIDLNAKTMSLMGVSQFNFQEGSAGAGGGVESLSTNSTVANQSSNGILENRAFYNQSRRLESSNPTS
jgi:hypothetical protein